VDNAKGEDEAPPSYPHSRALILALNMAERTVTVEAQFNHPHGAGNWAQRRGNLQVMENGNVFMGWSERGLMSEHAADGTLLVEAYFSVDWIGNYRSYEYPMDRWVGKPNRPPDVVARAFTDDSFGTRTRVWVSWNGATEVKSWEVLKAVPTGVVVGSNAARKLEGTRKVDSKSGSLLLAAVSKHGFETTIDVHGFVAYLVVQAIDAKGTVLGTSGVRRTVIEETVSNDEVAEELQWVESMRTPRGTGGCIAEECSEKEMSMPTMLRMQDYAVRGRRWISGWGFIVGVMFTVLVGTRWRIGHSGRGAARLGNFSDQVNHSGQARPEKGTVVMIRFRERHCTTCPYKWLCQRHVANPSVLVAQQAQFPEAMINPMNGNQWSILYVPIGTKI